MVNLTGKKAIVTGGRRGIGRAIVEVLAKQGADILMADRNVKESTAVAQEISEATGQRIISTLVDVTNSQHAKSMVEVALQEFGRIDILVNNAGTTRDTLIMRMAEEDWDIVIDTNLKGVYNCSKDRKSVV